MIDIWNVWRLQASHGGGYRLNVNPEVSHKVKTIFHVLVIPFDRFGIITTIDLSGCMAIDPTSVIDCVQYFTKVTTFVCRGCSHFSQYNLTGIVTKIAKLCYFDATYCGDVSSVQAYVMLASAKNLEKYSVMPAIEKNYINEWSKLLSTFRMVTFGHPVRAILPNYGNLILYSRIGQDEENIEA